MAARLKRLALVATGGSPVAPGPASGEPPVATIACRLLSLRDEDEDLHPGRGQGVAVGHRRGLRPHAEELGSLEDFECLEDLLDNGNGASRQQVVYAANHDLREVVREIVDATTPEGAETPNQ